MPDDIKYYKILKTFETKLKECSRAKKTSSDKEKEKDLQ